MEWISVKDKKPCSGERVLSIDMNESESLIIIVTYYIFEGEESWSCSDYWERTITHWMPLPDIPKIDSAQIDSVQCNNPKMLWK